jgi:hypothetical protein
MIAIRARYRVAIPIPTLVRAPLQPPVPRTQALLAASCTVRVATKTTGSDGSRLAAPPQRQIAPGSIAAATIRSFSGDRPHRHAQGFLKDLRGLRNLTNERGYSVIAGAETVCDRSKIGDGGNGKVADSSALFS